MTNPTGPATGSLRVVRDGGWSGHAPGCRSANRANNNPSNTNNNVGFRVCLQAGGS